MAATGSGRETVPDDPRGLPIHRVGPRDRWTAALVLLGVAIAARAASVGNPVVHIDEQFYLMMADRMLHGAVPYVDIWDRKPIGLFLLYAPFAALGANAVVGYQVAALMATTGVAFLVWGMARHFASRGSALIVAALYIICLNLAGGNGGQAPVFYNLPVAGAVAILMAAQPAAAMRGDLRWRGADAMLLLGIALQIKYSVAFEGLFVGVAFIVIARRAGRSMGALGTDIAVWLVIAATPTALAAGGYWAMGHLPEWLFANVTSILQRGHESAGIRLGRALVLCALAAPLALPAAFRRFAGRSRTSPRLILADAWSASALVGVALFGTWFTHYALPFFAPLAVSVAPLGDTRAGRAYLLALLLIGGCAGQYVIRKHTQARGDANVLSAALTAVEGHRRCVFVYDGYVALYTVSHSCLPTTRPFPAHLHSRMEGGATGIDQRAEVLRIMAARPDRIVTMEPAYPDEDLRVRREVYAILAREYRPLFRSTTRMRQLVVYGRDPLSAGR